MKMHVACNAVVVAIAVVVVSGFSTNTTPKPSLGTSVGKIFSSQTQLFSAIDESKEVACSEEMVRRKMLAARLQRQKGDAHASVLGGVDNAAAVSKTEETPNEDGVDNTEAEASESKAHFADAIESDDDDVETATVDIMKEDKEPKEPLVSSSTPASQSTSSKPKAPKEENGINLEIVAKVATSIAKEVAVDLLSLVRFGAANLLTQSLPENQRQDLLRRMGAQMLPAAEDARKAEKEKEDLVAKAVAELEEGRASIQEEIALARAEEAQMNEKQWALEKEDIIRQMEEAANARIKDELEVQQMRLQHEQQKALEEKEAELKEERKRIAMMEGEREALEKENENLAKESKLAMQEVGEVSDLFVGATEEEEEQNRLLEELLDKRKKQQLALESIEEELRVSVANEAEERDRLNKLLEKRKEQQIELSVVEENLRLQVAEIEAEKAQIKELLSELELMKQKETELQEMNRSETKISDDSIPQAAEEAGGEELLHPVLGAVVADLGYKRVHFVSAAKLGNIPVWNKNRTYRNSRAKAMAAEKAKTMELGFPGTICLYEGLDGKLSIVDGQHRVGMMAALKTSFNKKKVKGEDLGGLEDIDSVFDKILVEVYPQPAQKGDDKENPAAAKDKFAEKVFVEINKAEPVKLIDMPGVASAAERKVITEAVESLSANYPTMFSPSQRCRVPNVNVDNLRSVIFGANILKRHKLTTSKKLLEWLLEKNAALGDAYESNEEKQSLVSNKQWTKASTNNFYLGLESSWLYK